MPTRSISTPDLSHKVSLSGLLLNNSHIYPNEGDEDLIMISRSDGRRHDLLQVIGNNPSTSSTSSSSVSSDPSFITDGKKDEKANFINIHRSDGVTHDIVKVFKMQSTSNVEKSVNLKNKFSISSSSIDVSNLKLSPSIEDKNSNLVDLTSINQPLVPSSVLLKHIRIVHLSDTHNFLHKYPRNHFLPTGHILVHTGNFTNNGTAEEFNQFNEWLNSVAHLYHYRVVILGACDVKKFGNNFEAMKKMLSYATHVLCNESAVILGINFYGVPWNSQNTVKKNFSLRFSSSSSLENIPENTEVLLTHGPAYQRLDVTYPLNHDKEVDTDSKLCKSKKEREKDREIGEEIEHWGSKELLDIINKFKPNLHLHGLAKESRGILPSFANSTMTVNSCMCNRERTVMYAAPHVVLATMFPMEFHHGVSWHFSMAPFAE